MRWYLAVDWVLCSIFLLFFNKPLRTWFIMWARQNCNTLMTLSFFHPTDLVIYLSLWLLTRNLTLFLSILLPVKVQWVFGVSKMFWGEFKAYIRGFLDCLTFSPSWAFPTQFLAMLKSLTISLVSKTVSFYVSLMALKGKNLNVNLTRRGSLFRG